MVESKVMVGREREGCCLKVFCLEGEHIYFNMEIKKYNGCHIMKG